MPGVCPYMEVGVGVSESWPGLLGPVAVQAAGSPSLSGRGRAWSWVKVLYVSGTHQPDAHSTENLQTVNTVTTVYLTQARNQLTHKDV